MLKGATMYLGRMRRVVVAATMGVAVALLVPAQPSSAARTSDPPSSIEELRKVVASGETPPVVNLSTKIAAAQAKAPSVDTSAATCPTEGEGIKPDADAPKDAFGTCVRRLNTLPKTPTSLREANPVALADDVPEGWSKQSAGTIPTWCKLNTTATHLRMRECHEDAIEHIVFVKQTGIILGRSVLHYWEWEELSNKDRSWKHDITAYVESSVDLGLGTFVTGLGWCATGCDVTIPPGETLTLLTPGSWFRGHWSMSSQGGEDKDTTYIQSDTDLLFINPAVPQDPERISTEVDFHNRCDSTLAETPREGGCTFNEVEPTLRLDKSATSIYREHALFVENAQASTPDHFGARGRGEPLNRLINVKRQTDNRTVSCRGFTKQFSDDSCDEYPYASTYQGANEIGRDRTSVGHVPEKQNERGGTVLKNFLLANRVIDMDRYWVDVQDGPGDDETEGTDNPPTVDAGEWVSGNEGAALPVQGSADDEQGVPDVTWSYEAGDVDVGATCKFVDPHALETTFTCTDDGAFTLTLTADDGVNPPVSDSTEARVSNVAPRFGHNPPDFAPAKATDDGAAAAGLAPAPWTLFRAGKPVTLSTPYEDPGTNDTQECVVDWDDGTPAQTYSGHGSTCDATHTYPHAGMYTIKLSTTDDDGDADHWTTMIVVYDPKAGWNNSDGSMLSAPGAWASQPSTSGEQWFHLAAKYYPQNDTVPVGDAQTWLANSSFRFTSASNGVDWLVVTRDGKIASKGRGKLQGLTGDYGYVFYGYDGCANGQSPNCRPGPDRFRVVVWPLSEGAYPTGNAVYDNRPNTDYDLDRANPQELKSGIVTIHPPN
jgi:hypothetical protein